MSWLFVRGYDSVWGCMRTYVCMPFVWFSWAVGAFILILVWHILACRDLEVWRLVGLKVLFTCLWDRMGWRPGLVR